MIGNIEDLETLKTRLSKTGRNANSIFGFGSQEISELHDTLSHCFQLIDDYEEGLTDENVIAFAEDVINNLRDDLDLKTENGKILAALLDDIWGQETDVSKKSVA